MYSINSYGGKRARIRVGPLHYIHIHTYVLVLPEIKGNIRRILFPLELSEHGDLIKWRLMRGGTRTCDSVCCTNAFQTAAFSSFPRQCHPPSRRHRLKQIQEVNTERCYSFLFDVPCTAWQKVMRYRASRPFASRQSVAFNQPE